MGVIYLQLGWDADLREAGGPDSPNFRKHNAIRLMQRRPELAGRLLTKGSWDYGIIDDLKPQPGDYVIERPRQSGFSGTNLDNYLRSRAIRTLIFTGIASNICVESTIRDAYFLEYFPILVSDCTWQAGPRFVHDATLFNVETFFGWVTTSVEYNAALQTIMPADRAYKQAALQ
jgi:ureidoacrylate peracid hydrolase